MERATSLTQTENIQLVLLEMCRTKRVRCLMKREILGLQLQEILSLKRALLQLLRRIRHTRESLHPHQEH